MRGILALLLLCAAPAAGQSNRPPAEWANRQLADPKAEAEATALMEELRCVVCQGQSIADSDAEIAGDMRHLVRTRIAAGESPSDVRQWLIDRYGHWVTFRPPVEPLTWPLWAGPALFIGLGLVLVWRRIGLRR